MLSYQLNSWIFKIYSGMEIPDGQHAGFEPLKI